MPRWPYPYRNTPIRVTKTSGTQWYMPTYTYTVTGSAYAPTGSAIADAWQHWNVGARNTATGHVWATWTDSQTITIPFTEQAPRDLAAERARLAAAHQARSLAVVRARTMLDAVLTLEQKAELERHGYFHVVGSRGRRYCIRARGQAGNVSLLRPDGQVQATLCCHPRMEVPDPDAWLAQMLAIETDEDLFLATANATGALPDGFDRRAVLARVA